MAVLELAGGQPALRDHQPVRNPDEFRIGEFNTRAGIAIVEQDIEAGFCEF